MLFNPLFLQVINNQEPVSTKTQKLSNSSYLFSDIIKVSVENEMQNSNSLGAKSVVSGDSSAEFIGKQMVNIPLELKSDTNNTISVESVIEQLVNQLRNSNSSDNSQNLGLSENFLKSINSDGAGSDTQFFDQSKICELISKLVNNSQFNGKANLVIDRQKLLQDNYSSALDEITKNEITPESLLNLLKMGNTLSLESSPAEKNLGLLITLIEHTDGSEAGTEVKSLDGSIDLGVKNIFKNKEKVFKLTDLIGDSQNKLNPDAALYEIKISVIDQSANIDQSNNLVTQGLDIKADSENKFKVDIVFQDSESAAVTDFSALNKMMPPDEMFASTSVKASELSKISSSFNKSLNADAQQLKNITKNSQEIVSNLTTTETDAEAIPAAADLNKVNNPAVVSGNAKQNVNASVDGIVQNVKQSTEKTLSQEINPAENTLTKEINTADAGKTKTQQNAKSAVNTENAASFAKLSGTIKSQLFKTAEISKSANTVKTPDQAGIGKDLSGKAVNINAKDAAAQSDLKAETESPFKAGKQDIQTETPANETSGQITADQDSEKNSSNAVNGKQAFQEKIETAGKPLEAEKTQILNKEVNTEDKDINKKSGTPEDNKSVNPKTELADDSKDKISSEAKPNNAGDVKESIKANTHPANNAAASQVNKTEGQDTQDKNTESTKPEIKDNSKAAAAVDENKNSENNNNEKSLSDGNKGFDENKKSHDGKIVSETNFDKTLESVSKDKVGLEKGHYTDAARTVKAAEIVKEMSKHIQSSSNGTLYLKIDPEHLGTVKIAVEVVNKMVHANIEVENESARKMIENNLNQLYSNLNQNGVQLNSLNISLSNFEQKQGKGNTSKHRSSGYGEESDSPETSSADKEKSLGYNTYEYTV